MKEQNRLVLVKGMGYRILIINYRSAPILMTVNDRNPNSKVTPIFDKIVVIRR